jgi:hypothetical protein
MISNRKYSFAVVWYVLGIYYIHQLVFNYHYIGVVYAFDVSFQKQQSKIVQLIRLHHTYNKIHSFRQSDSVVFSVLNSPKRLTKLHYTSNTDKTTDDVITSWTPSIPKQRFERVADNKEELDELCLITIDNQLYNLTSWGK